MRTANLIYDHRTTKKQTHSGKNPIQSSSQRSRRLGNPLLRRENQTNHCENRETQNYRTNMTKQQQWKQLDDESKAITARFAGASKSEQRQLFAKLQEIVTARNALGVNPPIRFAR